MNAFLLRSLKVTSCVTAGFIGGYGLISANCATPEGSPSSFGVPVSRWDYNWDKREPYSLRKKTTDDEKPHPKPTATRHIYLIRHGQYDVEAEDDCDRKLTKIGQQQARFTGKRLKEIGITFSHFYVSNMTRALETAKLITEELGCGEFNVDPILREGPPLPPEPPVSHWNPEQYEFHVEGPRIEAAFRKYIHRADPEQTEDSHELIVCHANVIRYFTCRALQFPAEGWLRLALGNGSITKLSVTSSGRVVLRSLSETGHMDPEFLTYT